MKGSRVKSIEEPKKNIKTIREKIDKTYKFNKFFKNNK